MLITVLNVAAQRTWMRAGQSVMINAEWNSVLLPGRSFPQHLRQVAS